MNYDWAFLPMVDSSDLLGDASALQERMAEDSYLYFPKLLDPKKIVALRRAMLSALRDAGWVDPESVLIRGRAGALPVREGDDGFFDGYHAVQRLEQFHALAHDDTLLTTMSDVLGGEVFPHPLKIARIIFPDFQETATPPHQDYPNNQGTPDLTATWIPVGDIGHEMGGLAVLRGSHKWGRLPLTTHLGAGNRCAVLPLDMLEQCRWVSTEFEMGDVLVFPSLAVHASRHNLSPTFFRLSVDFRYQREGAPLTEGCLEPHFAKISWEEIYERWESDELEYYWKDHDYEVVPFEEFPLVVTGTETDSVAHFLEHDKRRLRAARAE